MRELSPDNKVCLALGYFDSVHVGHRSIIAAADSYAKSHGLFSAVATFSNNAYKLFNRDEKCVYTYTERLSLLDGLCDFVLPMRFDARMKNSSAEDFLNWLFSRYDIKAVVVGYDYLFGAGAKGDAELLKKYCGERGVECIVHDKIEIDGTRVSTTVIKTLLASGDVESAEKYLGAPFMLTGKIVHGRGAGRMFDIPTANIKIPLDKLLPKSGVYGAECVIDDERYFGAVNVGGRPTFDLSKTVVEMMIKDFDDNVYDKNICVYFRKFLRPVKKFDTPAQLSKQVREDICWSEK
ncbi:MAG: riboflavin biosynthesis protein RibF [Clostridiales bacterium]|nr:riboflavin biosynthesis protein RibF [Clostridiales bacterium]